MRAEKGVYSPHLVIAFAQVAAGLGHLRVTDALYRGLPQGLSAILLSTHDNDIASMHRFSSNNPLGIFMMEWAQDGFGESFITPIYRWLLRRPSRILEEQLLNLLDQHVHHPHTLLVVATHFGLGHAVAAMKEAFSKKYDIRVVLVVVVTDDSPQKIWAVPGADLIFVPSNLTKKKLLAYASKKLHISEDGIIVSPYCVSPRLAEGFPAAQYDLRMKQLSAKENVSINIAIPVSGAVVQLNFHTGLIHALSRNDHRWHFHIICREMPFTRNFLHQLKNKQFVHLLTSHYDRELIEMYEHLYQKNVIACEVTKPSEQAFKAMLRPYDVGGAIMLFTSPVGRQEYDNIAFLMRHGLIPTDEEQKQLWQMATNSSYGDDPLYKVLLDKAQYWRGVRLPTSPHVAAHFIQWLRSADIFTRMGTFDHKHEDLECSGDGVRLFWERINEYLCKLK